VKKIEPTKYVTASAKPPTAFTYAGTDPSTKPDEPSMNSQAIAALRRTGLTRIHASYSACYDQICYQRATHWLTHSG
jgi:hypothetical protein